MEKQISELINGYRQGRLGRREFLQNILIVPGGAAIAAATLSMAPQKAQAQFALPHGFSSAEKDFRWSRIRNLMSELGLDCLILPKGRGDGVNSLQYAEYASNAAFMNPGAVIFPAKGEPAIIGSIQLPNSWITNVAGKWFEGGEQLPIGGHIIDFVTDMGYAKGNIGVVGTQANVEGLNEFINEGFVDYATWSTVTAGLPDASFTDITPQFGEMMVVKSQEVLSGVRSSAAVGENLHKMLLEITKAGVDPVDFRVAIAEHFIRSGARSDVQALEMAPGKIRDGAVINSEYGIIHGGGYAQCTLCMAVGKVSKQTEELHEVAKESLQYGLDNLRPGKTFGEVIAGMEEIIFGAGYWHGFPQIHGLLPMFMVGNVYANEPPAQSSKVIGADVVIKPDMAFSFEPGARRGKAPMGSQVKLGCTAIIQEDGLEVLNTLGLNMQRL